MNKYFENYSKNINRINILIVLFALIILINFFSNQIISNPPLKKLITKHGYKEKTIYGKRGKITDSKNRELAVSINKYTFWVNTNRRNDQEYIANLFSDSFNKSSEYYIEKLKNKSNYLILEKNITDKDAEKILKNWNKNRTSGLNKDKKINRLYKYNKTGCQTIGYVNNIGDGIIGVEKSLNELLSGDTIKIKLRKGPKGGYYRDLTIQQDSINGFDIQLTIDIEIQKIIQEELKIICDKSYAKSANAILMNPYNGDIIAMASVPEFDPNKYSNYSIESYKNRVISESYEPGSTLKIVPLALALDLNISSLQDSFYCENGKYKLTNNLWLHDHEEHENLSLEEIMIYSSNIGFSKLSDNFNNKNLFKYLKYFGFGTRSFISLANEEKGKIRNLSNWSRTSKKYISIGQEISITNLQLALAYSAIANNGYLVKPNIIKKVSKNNLEKKYIIDKYIRKVINKKTSKKILSTLDKVTKIGTAQDINLNGYKVAGKTGTAQKSVNGEYTKFTSTFASIFPSDNPRYVLIVTIDEPKYGYHWASMSAVPASKEIIKRMVVIDETLHYAITNNKYPNSKELYKNEKIMLGNFISENKSTENNNQLPFPNIKGKTLTEAIKIVKKYKIKLNPNGGISGKIFSQSIRPGTLFQSGEICNVELKNHEIK